MIYFISDLHGEKSEALEAYLKIATEKDLLIILGDVGLNFYDTLENMEFTRYFMSLDKKIAFLDGNHENFDYLKTFCCKEWNGGEVGRLTKNIVYLKRGNIYTLEGKTFFVFGGCKSSSKWKENGLWYPEEEPSDEEINLAYKNLEKYNYKVDYICTHNYDYKKKNVSVKLMELTDFIDKNVEFKRWYSGHWHQNFELDNKHRVVYDKLICIE